ncbi:hypothetical protein [Paenibacillus solani]|uniref:hypothetical protein n=1 Tax=Paenibacillus solani TaxID=1705565 RepID=UPI0006C88EFB|nr:hypothetical protein [Paenibacillus solani]
MADRTGGTWSRLAFLSVRAIHPNNLFWVPQREDIEKIRDLYFPNTAVLVYRNNRIITKIMEDNFIPSSIIELETKEKNGVYISPEIITVNGSLSVLTDTNGRGWELKAGNSVEYVFEKYKSEVVEYQNILIGYVKDGVLNPSQKFDQLKGNYNLTIEESGRYYFYIINASSDTIALKEGELRLTKHN